MNALKDIKLQLILALGAILRIWDLEGMNYHHDELSALLRCRFESLTELINHGVIPDGHPALTQVLLWFWTNLVGMDPFLVKLPFILAGVVSIFLVFKLCELLFDKRSAYISATLFSVLQYAIVYAQWARPYSLGILFMLLALVFLVQYARSNQAISLLGFAIGTALTAYTHYFSLLTLLLFTVSFWLIIFNRRQKLYALSAGLLAFLFWVPHLSITLHHLSLGGIGDWLKPPSSDFWQNLLAYTFHYEVLFLIPLFFSFAYFLNRLDSNRIILPKRIVLLLTIVLTYAIAYYYSLNVEPLLHHGTMAFTVPFFCILVGSLLYKVNSDIRWIVMISYALIGTNSLIVNRDHYQLNYATAYGDAFSWSEELGRPLYFDLREDAVDLLIEIGEATDNSISIRQIGYENWAAHLQQLRSDTLLIVVNPGSPPEILAAAINQFPTLVDMHAYHTTAAYLLTKNGNAEKKKATGFHLSSLAEEYSRTIEIESSELADELLIVHASFESQLPTTSSLLISEYANDSLNLFWRGSQINAPMRSISGKSATALVDVRDLHLLSQEGLFKAYVWNRDNMELKNLEINSFRFRANPDRYRLFQE